MDKVRTKTRNTRNYSGRHAGEICPPDKRVRPYIPPEPHYGMADGVPVTAYRVTPSPHGEPRHGFAYESTKRVHID